MFKDIYGDETKSHMQKFYSLISGEIILNNAYGIKRDDQVRIEFINNLLQRIFTGKNITYDYGSMRIKGYYLFKIDDKPLWFTIKNIKPYTSGGTAKGDFYKDEYYLNSDSVTRFCDAPWHNKLKGQSTFVISIDRPTDSEGNLVEQDTLISITETSEMMYSRGKKNDKSEEVSKTLYLRQWEYLHTMQNGLLVKENFTKSSHKGRIINSIVTTYAHLDEYVDEFRSFISPMTRKLVDTDEYLKIESIIGIDKYVELKTSIRNAKVQRLFRNSLISEVNYLKPGSYDMTNSYNKLNPDENKRNIIVASHIIPYSSVDLDTAGAAKHSNGLLIPAPFDQLFDKGLITFDHKTGKVIKSDWITKQNINNQIDLDSVVIDPVFLNDERKENLRLHNIQFADNDFNI